MKRILIVDDDFLVRDMLERLMRKARYDTETAENGARAMALHRKHPVDLVITDIRMPGREGLDPVAEFRTSAPGVKIIAVSGGGRIDSSRSLRTAPLGADRTFVKPVDTAQLLSAVEELTSSPAT